MMSRAVKQWLERFLSERRSRSEDGPLKEPDGRPLYGYRCSERDYGALKNLLKIVAVRCGHPEQWIDWECAAFCLFAAEWWRREHIGGRWKWGRLLDAVGLRKHLPPALRARTVDRGLAYWRLQLLEGGAGQNLYMFSLAAQAGLPLQLVRLEHARLRTLFQRMFRELSIYGPVLDPFDLAREFDHLLPTSLCQPEVLRAAGSLALHIWKLQAEVAESATPLVTLDRRRPGWRDDLPLDLDDVVARDLLSGLVDDAAQARRRSAARPTVRTALVQASHDEGAWVLVRRFSAAPTIPRLDLARLLGCSEDELSSRLRLSLQAGDAPSEQVAIATRQSAVDGGEPTYRVETLVERLAFDGSMAGDDVTLEAASLAAHFGPLAIEGGAGLSDLLPWVFADDEERPLIGEGSASGRWPALLLCVDSRWRVVADEQAAEIEHLGRLAEPSRSVWRIRGRVHVEDPDGQMRWSYRTSQQREDVRRYRLLPRPVSGMPPQSRERVSAGPPLVQAQGPDGAWTWGASHEQQWCTEGAHTGWLQLGGYTPLGRGTVRVVRSGELQLLRTLTVLPATIAFSAEPDRRRCRGRWRLTGIAGAEVGVVPPACPGLTVQATSAAQPDACAIEVAVDESCPPESWPETVAIQLKWATGGRAELELPLPLERMSFVDRQGRSVVKHARVATTRMVALQAEARSVGKRQHYLVQINPPAGAADPRWGQELERVFPIVETENTAARFELSRLREVAEEYLALSRDLDAEVSIKLSRQGVFSSTATLSVGRFDGSIELLPEHGIATLANAHAHVRIKHVRVEAWPLEEPTEERAVPLGYAGWPGIWPLALSELRPGTWWVCGWEGSWLRFRPALLEVPREAPGDAESSGLRGLAAIVERRDPGQRRRELEGLLPQLAADPGHPDWRQLGCYLDAMERFPPSGFDVLDAMLDCPEAIAAAMVRASRERFQRWWHGLDQLPFFWATMPVSVWVDAFRRYRDHLEQTLDGLPGVSAAQLVKDQLIRLRDTGSALQGGYQIVAEAVAERVLGRSLDIGELSVARAMGDALRSGVIERAREDLLRMHADDNWPLVRGPSLRERLAPIAHVIGDHWISAPIAHQRSVIDAPVAAAWIAATGYRTPSMERLPLRLKRLRSFDPHWFDTAYASTLASAIVRLEELEEN